MIPLRPRSKEALIKWTEYQTRLPTQEELSQWFTSSTANIAIVTGLLSNIVVIDADGPIGKAWLKTKNLTSPITALTGHGLQLVFRHPGPGIKVCNSASEVAPGIDVRGDGGYIVAAPSIHPNGRRYTWARAITVSTVKDLPSLPTWLLTRLTSTPLPTAQPTTKSNTAGWISDALGGMKHGNIDTTLTSVLGRMRRDGYSENDAAVLLRPHAERAGATPGHLEDKVRNVWGRYESRALPGMVSQSGTLRIHSPISSREEYERIKAQEGTKPEFETGFPTLDNYIKGLKRQELFTVAARTGTGKTNCVLAIASNLCSAGRKVLFFSTEMSFNSIWDRYKQTLKDPETFSAHQFYVSDEFSPDLARIEAALREVTPDVFIFDHVNHVSEENTSLGTFMLGLKNLARQFNIPGIVAAQLNRSADWVEGGERVAPRMSMIKGSGTIEQVSSAVLLLSEVRVGPDRNDILGVVDKSRYGEKGNVNFALLKAPYRMVETND